MDIERATLEDVPELCELLDLLFSQEEEFEADCAIQAAGLRQIIEQPERGQILVLREGTAVIGMVSLLFTISTALGSRVALLEDMVVRPSYRNRGGGSMLLQAAVEAAQLAGCLRITLLTDRSNEAAQAFYLRHGFAFSGMIPMRLRLD